MRTVWEECDVVPARRLRLRSQVYGRNPTGANHCIMAQTIGTKKIYYMGNLTSGDLVEVGSMEDMIRVLNQGEYLPVVEN